MEIMAGRGTPSGGVLIDATHMGKKFLLENFKGMVDRCREYGFDLINSRVEVSPSAHYHMGGVKIDIHCRCNVPGLFVAGEDAGGVHGANRLGGNGVADSIVFGARAGDAMVDFVASSSQPAYSESQARQLAEQWAEPLERNSGENPFRLRKQLEKTMWLKAGVVRNGKSLAEAVPELQEIRDRVKSADGSGIPLYNAKWNEAINLANMSVVAGMLARSALMRQESRGAHYRQDFPDKDVNWLKNICCRPQPDGDMLFWTTPVTFSRLTPPELKESQEVGEPQMHANARR
jgi:succinate dehydrogenase / fumarate reductase flavoprotein subunit/fumarate reductase flavoprotein subunit